MARRGLCRACPPGAGLARVGGACPPRRVEGSRPPEPLWNSDMYALQHDAETAAAVSFLARQQSGGREICERPPLPLVSGPLRDLCGHVSIRLPLGSALSTLNCLLSRLESAFMRIGPIRPRKSFGMRGSVEKVAQIRVHKRFRIYFLRMRAFVTPLECALTKKGGGGTPSLDALCI